jgi:imidazolonepropionase-like amidohydrolase
MRTVFLGIIALLATTISQAGWGAEGTNSFVIRHVDVFDGRAVKRAQDVIVRDGLIHAVGTHLAIPAGLAVIDGEGRTLLPGLIDSHVHSGGNSQADALRFGVTTELDMFMNWHGIAAARAQRQTLARTDKSDLWSSGTLATVPGGHGTEFGLKIPTLTDASQAQSWVDGRVAEGSDYIKIVLEPGFAKHPIPTLSPETVTALVAAAHHDGRMAVVHVQTLESARVAVSAGVDALAHIFFDQQADDAFVKLARQRQLFVIATLAVFSSYSCGPTAPSLAKDPSIQPYLTKEQVAMLGANFGMCLPGALETAQKNVRILHEAGIALLAGTDAGNPGTTHGASLLGEIELLTQSGLTPAEALAAATSVPAEHFGLKDRGHIAPGKRADLLLVEGDPTRDPAAIRRIAAVWMNGYPVSRDRPPESAAGAGFPAKFHLVQGPLATQSPGAVYSGHIIITGSSGTLDVTLPGDGQLTGEWHVLASNAPASADAAGSGTVADLSREWDIVHGAGYYQAHVKGNPAYSRAVLSSGTSATLTAEIIGDESSGGFFGIARDSHGNLYEVAFGE